MTTLERWLAEWIPKLPSAIWNLHSLCQRFKYSTGGVWMSNASANSWCKSIHPLNKIQMRSFNRGAQLDHPFEMYTLTTVGPFEVKRCNLTILTFWDKSMKAYEHFWLLRYGFISKIQNFQVTAFYFKRAALWMICSKSFTGKLWIINALAHRNMFIICLLVTVGQPKRELDSCFLKLCIDLTEKWA
jgi:hypothetical protein